MIGFKVDEIKGLFFDAAAVMAATEKAERQVLSRFGAFVRQRAKSSIRTRKRVADPAAPPSSHLGLIRQFIYFAFEPVQKSVVIGPARLNGRLGDALEALEYGGTSEVADHHGKDRRRVQIRAHPFMGPAFNAELPGLDKMWRDSIR